MTPKVALVYHLNLNHYSLSAKMRTEFVRSYLEEMLTAIEVPIILSKTNFSAPQLLQTKISDIQDFSNKANSLLTSKRADYASHKFIWKDFRIGLHIIPFSTFKFVCTFDCKNAQETTCLTEYRLKPKEKKPIYLQRNFEGESYQFHCEVQKINRGLLTRTPLAIIHNQQYFNGLLTDKYLTYPVVISKSPQIYYLLNQLRRNLFYRLQKEKKAGTISADAHLGNLPYARDRMPKCEIQHLRLETRLFENLLSS